MGFLSSLFVSLIMQPLKKLDRLSVAWLHSAFCPLDSFLVPLGRVVLSRAGWIWVWVCEDYVAGGAPGVVFFAMLVARSAPTPMNSLKVVRGGLHCSAHTQNAAKSNRRKSHLPLLTYLLLRGAQGQYPLRSFQIFL